jgi:dephospho-CoA kinase
MIHSADQIAREILHTQDVTAKLSSRWGDSAITDGKLDHRKIASIVFEAPEELKFLNSIVHPGTIKRIWDLILGCQEDHILFEVPLMFEANLEGMFDYIILISCPEEIRLKRLLQRDGGDTKLAMRKIASQMPEEKKIPRCDLVIHNTGDKNELLDRAKEFSSCIGSIRHRKSFSRHPDSPSVS